MSTPILPNWLLEKLDNCPQSGGGVHRWLFDIARQLLWHLPPEEVFRLLKAKSAHCGRAVPDREIWSAINDAARVQWRPGLDATTSSFAKEPTPRYRPLKLARFAREITEEVNATYLASRSPIVCWNRSPAGFLHKLYRQGEKVVVFDVFESQGCDLWECGGPTGNLASLNHLKAGCANVWFLPNPVDGLYHWNPRQQKKSRRSEESVTSWRYALIESDQAPKGLWLKVLVQLPLPIASIADSGGASIHALVRIDANSKPEWDAIVRGELKAQLAMLGADPHALTAVRLSRLANCCREQTGNLQTLLYLNSEPDCIPICEKPLREPPEAVWLRWATSLLASRQAKPLEIRRCLAGLGQFTSQPEVDQTIQALKESLCH